MPHCRSCAALLLSVLIVSAFGAAHAVEINPGGTGQAIIVPLWATTGGHDTLMTVTPLPDVNDASSTDPAAVLLRLRDADGVAVYSTSIYFNRPYEQWQLTLHANDYGGSDVAISSNGCALSGSFDTAAPMDPVRPIPARYGFAELIVMGTITDADLLAAIGSGDCQRLADRWKWAGGAWTTGAGRSVGLGQPTTRLRVDTSLINVDRGTVYAIPPTALVQFSDIIQNIPPDWPGLLSLERAHDSGTVNNATTGRRCLDGLCETHTFTSPGNAVKFALSSELVTGSYLEHPGLGARTELIATNPTSYFDNGAGASLLEGAVLDHQGNRVNDYRYVDCTISPAPPGGCIAFGWLLGATHSIGLITPREYPYQPAVSPILSLPIDFMGEVMVPTFEYDAVHQGTFVLNRHPYFTELGLNAAYGAPIITLVLKEVVNASVGDSSDGPVRANYGQLQQVEYHRAPQQWQ